MSSDSSYFNNHEEEMLQEIYSLAEHFHHKYFIFIIQDLTFSIHLKIIVKSDQIIRNWLQVLWLLMAVGML